jgi:GAF domain-containing protein
LLVEDRLVGILALFARQPLAEDILEALLSIADIIAQGIERRHAREALQRLNEELEARVQLRTGTAAYGRPRLD